MHIPDKKLKIKDFLEELAECSLEGNSKDKELYKDKLTSIYKDGYKHSFQEILGILNIKISKDEYAIEQLNSNLLILAEFFKDENNSVNKAIKNFIDFVLLELQRINIIRAIDAETERLNNKLSTKTSEIEKSFKEIQSNMDVFNSELKSQKFDLIALVTLVFSAFTLISLNLTLFAAGFEKFDRVYKFILMIGGVNFILVTAIFSIYSLIGQIGGTKFEFNKTLWITFSLLGLFFIGSIIYVHYCIL